MGDDYGQYFCPITRAAEIVATRWTPVIVRNLLLGCTTFNEICEGAPGIPRSVLTERLRQLEHAGVVERRPKSSGRGSEYVLTESGLALEEVIDAMGFWGERWLDASPRLTDPGVLLWSICKCLDPSQLPDSRVTVRVSLRDVPRKTYWMVVQRPKPEVCIKPPGFDEDLRMTSDSEWLAKWHMGKLSLGDAMHAGVIALEGPTHLVREFAGWGGLHPYVE